jgi:nucleoside-diphosphate-sugar epimerase
VRVLLTGASGFLGSHIADRLEREDVTLRLMLRPTSSLRFLADLAGKYERADGDLRDAASMARALEDVDCVIACGGLTWARTEADYRAVNVEGTRRLVEASVAAGVKRFVYVSSLAALGPSPDGKPPSMKTTAPVSVYGRSKRDGELAALAAAGAMPLTIVRPPIIYGPRDTAMLPAYRVMRWLRLAPVYGDGRHVLSFIHALDCAAAIAGLAVTETQPGAIYNVSDGGLYTWRDLAFAYGKAINRRSLIVNMPSWLYAAAGRIGSAITSLTGLGVPVDMQRVNEMRQRYWVSDNEAISRDLGWQPQYDLVSGLAQTEAWRRQNGWH